MIIHSMAASGAIDLHVPVPIPYALDDLVHRDLSNGDESICACTRPWQTQADTIPDCRAHSLKAKLQTAEKFTIKVQDQFTSSEILHILELANQG